MNIQALQQLLADPAYAELSDQQAADALNAKSVITTREMLVTERTLYGALGPVMAEDILQRLDAAAEQNAVIARVRAWLRPAEGGIDVGHAATRAQLDALVPAVLTAEQSAAIKALGESLVTPLQSIGHLGAPIAVEEVTTLRAL